MSRPTPFSTKNVTPSRAVPETPVPVAEERDARRRDRRDRDRLERAEAEHAVQRDEDEVGNDDPERADGEELGALVDDLPEAPVQASEPLERRGRKAGTAQRGFQASSGVEGPWSTWPDARASAGSIASCPSGADCRAAHTHLRYDQNRNAVPSTMPMLLATTLASLPVSPRP